MLTDSDRQLLIDATTAARARMREDRDSWPDVERDDGPVHISVVIAEWMAMHGLSEQYAQWRARHGQPVGEPALTQCGEATQ